MNNAISEIKNTLEATNSRITEAEDRISELEDRMVEINESERVKEKRIKRNEDNLRDLQDNIKHYNIRIIGVPEDKKKDHEKILKEIIVENFPKIRKEIITLGLSCKGLCASWLDYFLPHFREVFNYYLLKYFLMVLTDPSQARKLKL